MIFAALAALIAAIAALVALQALTLRSLGQASHEARSERAEAIECFRHIVSSDAADRRVIEVEHRRERERLMRAIVARNVPELRALEQVIGDDIADDRRRLHAVGEDGHPSNPDVPLHPEGL